MNESRQRREQEQKRVVVPPSTLPKNVIVVLTRAGEPSGRRRSRGLLFHLVCAQETEREELKVVLDCGDCQRVLTLPKNVIAVLTRAGEPNGRRRSGGLLFHLVCAQETEWEELKVLLDCGDCQRENFN